MDDLTMEASCHREAEIAEALRITIDGQRVGLEEVD